MPTSILELISQIEKRPSMYIGKNSISCLRAFLDGWTFRSSENISDMDKFNKFQSWIEERYNLPQTQSWDRIILFYSVDESDALQNFFRLHKLFLSESISM